MPIKEKKPITQPFILKIQRTIQECHMIRKGDAVLIGVSGGPDSMSLLHALIVLSGFMGIRLGVAHLNHCLRGIESDRDEKFVISVAQKHGLPFFVEKKNIFQEKEKTGLSIEEAGREARYHFFNSICRSMRFDKVAVAHHQGDNAEQILLNLLRGSGPSGIRGIPPVRENIIRPLIQTSRAEIIHFLELQKIDFVIDKTNEDDLFQRNRIRHQLIPLLESNYNPKISETLIRLGNILRTEEEWISNIITPFYDKATLTSDRHRRTLSISELLNFHPALQRRIIRKAIQAIKGNLRKISYSHIDAITDMIKNIAPDSRLDLPDRIRIIKQDSRLIVQKETQNLRISPMSAEKSDPVSFKYTVSRSAAESQKLIHIDEIKAWISFRKTECHLIPNLSGQDSQVAFFDWDRLEFPLIIRNFRAGDRFSPLGMNGTQKLKNFFINNKIKSTLRASVPLFLSGGTIIWVGGARISELAKITPETQIVLRIEISPETD